MNENRPFRSRSQAQDRRARRRLRVLFLARLARLVRLRARLAPSAEIERRFLDQALCSTLSDCNRLGLASKALALVEQGQRLKPRERRPKPTDVRPAA